jgi:hypothetical protein
VDYEEISEEKKMKKIQFHSAEFNIFSVFGKLLSGYICIRQPQCKKVHLLNRNHMNSSTSRQRMKEHETNSYLKSKSLWIKLV